MEMLTPFMLYLLTRLDVIAVTCMAVLGICGICTFIGTLHYSSEFSDGQERFLVFLGKYKIIKRITIACMVSVMVLIIVPSKKDMIIILGVPELVSTAKDIANSPRTSKVLEYLDTYLDKELKNIKEGKK